MLLKKLAWNLSQASAFNSSNLKSTREIKNFLIFPEPFGTIKDLKNLSLGKPIFLHLLMLGGSVQIKCRCKFWRYCTRIGHQRGPRLDRSFVRWNPFMRVTSCNVWNGLKRDSLGAGLLQVKPWKFPAWKRLALLAMERR